MELARELELYVHAGFTPAEALASATRAPAHLVGADTHTGSIAVGKAADLVLVDGDPSTNIGDLRHTPDCHDGGQPDGRRRFARRWWVGRAAAIIHPAVTPHPESSHRTLE